MAQGLDSIDPIRIRNSLLAWYDRHARKLPWRIGPADRARGQRPNPYHVWLSEVMLQQTQVATVTGYFTNFVRKWPDVRCLATAPVDDVMAAWAGLGYYSRARNLKKCAETIVGDHGGLFPQTAAELATLPGIGPYTAAAIAAIAFDKPVAAVDGNVERVVARIHAIGQPPNDAKKRIRDHAKALVGTHRPGDLAQAVMDLGATVCTPRKPACALCPIAKSCIAWLSGNPEGFPARGAKRHKPVRRGAAFVARRGDGAIFLRKRAEAGMLGGMSEVPTSGWSVAKDGETGADAAPFAGNWRNKGIVRHSFTHFDLELAIWFVETGEEGLASKGWWSAPTDLKHEALPTIMKKAIIAAVPTAFSAARAGFGTA